MLFHRPRQTVDTCPACRGDFVHPTHWEAEGQDNWWMLLRCGACDHRFDMVVCDDAAQDFDTKLDRDLFRIARAAESLHRQWRNAEIESFALAMEHDLITADDFAR